jgi:hypothetical protein
MASIINRLTRYSLEHRDLNDEELLEDDEYYDDLSGVMSTQRDRLEGLSYELHCIMEDSSNENLEAIKSIHVVVNEALNYIEEVAFRADCPWNLDIIEYDSDVAEAIEALHVGLSILDEI